MAVRTEILSRFAILALTDATVPRSVDGTVLVNASADESTEKSTRREFYDQ